METLELSDQGLRICFCVWILLVKDIANVNPLLYNLSKIIWNTFFGLGLDPDADLDAEN